MAVAPVVWKGLTEVLDRTFEEPEWGEPLPPLKLFFFFCLLGPHLWHMEVPKPGAESELQLLAYITTTATRDPSCVCDLRHSSQQRQILNPLSEARD